MKKKDFNIISFIPAKKNSRELKNKNFKKLNNLSLFEIAIHSSIKSKFISQTYISSDSNKILNTANKYKIITVKRSKKMSKFEIKPEQLILNFIKENLKNYFNEKTIMVYLQPTSPFRTHHHIDSAIKIFLKKKNKVLVSVEENKSFFKSFKKMNNRIQPYFNNKLITKNRQNLERIYSPNGAIYIFYVKDFFKKKKFDFKNAGYYIMNNIDSIDIDNLEDYNLAQIVSKKKLTYKS